jgi:Domain of unknown function (DUF5348)
MEITGTLRKNGLDEWEIVDGEGRVCVLSSGSVCEVQIGGSWIKTRIEFCHGSQPAVAGELPACGSPASHDGHYYAMALGVVLAEGLPARIIDDWFF